jgi:hypothetical protein
VICIFETGALEFIGKEVHKRKRSNGPALCDRPTHLNSTEPSSVGISPGHTQPPDTFLSRVRHARLKPIASPPSRRSCRTAPCHLPLPASTRIPCATALSLHCSSRRSTPRLFSTSLTTPTSRAAALLLSTSRAPELTTAGRAVPSQPPRAPLKLGPPPRTVDRRSEPTACNSMSFAPSL